MRQVRVLYETAAPSYDTRIVSSFYARCSSGFLCVPPVYCNRAACVYQAAFQTAFTLVSSSWRHVEDYLSSPWFNSATHTWGSLSPLHSSQSTTVAFIRPPFEQDMSKSESCRRWAISQSRQLHRTTSYLLAHGSTRRHTLTWGSLSPPHSSQLTTVAFIRPPFEKDISSKLESCRR